MKYKKFGLFSGTILFALFCHARNKSANSEFQFSQASNNIGFKIYSSLSQEQSKNILFSPYSVSNVLGIIYLGTQGQTKEQIRLVTGYPKDDNKTVAAIKSTADSLSNKKDVNLLVGNGFWARKDTDFEKGYSRYLSLGFNTSIERLDFYVDPEKARATINKWASEKTNGMIPEVFEPGTIRSLTQLVITNAIYFYGPWDSEFQKSKTSRRPFKSFSRSIDKDFMETTKYFRHREGPNFTSVELPYKDRDFAMLIVLPKEAQQEAVLAAIGEQNYHDWVPDIQTSVHLIIPKFSFDSGFDLTGPLRSLGIKNIFSPGGDFGAAIKSGNRTLPAEFSEIFHKAIIKVDEKGTEAAAVTGATRSKTSVSPPPIEFVADRPFLFFIRHLPSDTILFMGRVSEP